MDCIARVTFSPECAKVLFPSSVAVAVIAPMVPSVALGGGGAFSQRIDQVSPAATWTLSHTKNAIPNVQVYLSTGELIFSDVFSTATVVTVTFASAKSGFIIVT